MDENGSSFTEDVTVLYGGFTADGHVIYSTNDDGTIKVYEVPEHWPAEPHLDLLMEEYTQVIADYPTRTEISKADDEMMLAILSTMETQN